MPTFQINDAEWAALVEEPGDVFLLYCSIRRFMDYGTGIAGVRRRISEQMLREVLYVAPTRGRHESGSPSRQRIRSTLDRLLTLGVLEAKGPMVYQLPLASRDGLSETSATDEQPDQQPYEQPNGNQPKPSNGAASSGRRDGSATRSESADPLISNLPPVSGKSKEPPPTRASSIDSRDRFAMTSDWQPNPKTFQAVLAANGLAGTQLNLEHLVEFRSFWTATPDEHRTQARWEHALAQKLRREHRHAEANPGSRTKPGSSPRRQGPLSAVDRVRQAIADRRASEAAATASGATMGGDDGDLRPPLDGQFWNIG